MSERTVNTPCSEAVGGVGMTIELQMFCCYPREEQPELCR